MKKEHLLIKCLDEILEGKTTLEQCAARYPYLASELGDLLEIASKVSGSGTTPGDEFKKRAAGVLSREMQINAAASGAGNSPGWLKNIFSPKSFAFRFIVAVVIITLSSGGTVYASRNSLPGDTLYPVKRGVENARLVLAFSPESRADIYLERVQERVDETIQVTSKEGSPEVSILWDISEDIDEAVRHITNASNDRERLLQRLIEITDSEQQALAPLFEALSEGESSSLTQSIDALRRGKLIGEISYYNPAFLASSPSVDDESLESKLFKIEGYLITVEDGHWNVGGVKLANVSEPSGVPEVGAWLYIEGVVSTNTTFIWRIENGPVVGGKTIIEGIVSEKSEDDSVVCIGGLEFRDIESLKTVPVGTFLRIEGEEVEGFFHIDDDDEEENRDTEEYEESDGPNEGQKDIGNIQESSGGDDVDEENGDDLYGDDSDSQTVGATWEDRIGTDLSGDSYSEEESDEHQENEAFEGEEHDSSEGDEPESDREDSIDHEENDDD